MPCAGPAIRGCRLCLLVLVSWWSAFRWLISWHWSKLMWGLGVCEGVGTGVCGGGGWGFRGLSGGGFCCPGLVGGGGGEGGWGCVFLGAAPVRGGEVNPPPKGRGSPNL